MDALQQAQLDIAALLDCDELFRFVPVRVDRARDEAEATMIQTEIENALAGLLDKGGRSGTAVLVMLPEGQVPEPNLPGPVLEIEVTVRCMENPLFSEALTTGSGVTAEQCALNVLSLIHRWTNDGNPWRPDRRPLRSVDLKPGVICYDVVLLRSLGLPTRGRVARPLITDSESFVTLTCATAGAEIYYTLDGRLPTPGSGSLYEAPVDIVGPAEIRAMAWKTGLMPSDCASLSL